MMQLHIWIGRHYFFWFGMVRKVCDNIMLKGKEIQNHLDSFLCCEHITINCKPPHTLLP